MMEKLAHFECDYNNGMHPALLQRLVETNAAAAPGYGDDAYCHAARERIARACHLGPEGEVMLMVGGTQTNATVIDALLRGYEGVVCADTGHIAVHEAGAIEAAGHKVIALPGHDGKLSAAGLEAYLNAFRADETAPHMVQPGAVYITLPTELGTLYSREELADIHRVCTHHDLRLFIDGARLAYGLGSPACNVELAALPALCTAFTIGATKCGAMCGEAVVFGCGAPRHFFTTMKQHGAVLAKGRLLGVQMEALFTDDLYLRLGRHGTDMAGRLAAAFARHGLQPATPSPTNQQFFALTPQQHAALSRTIGYEPWERRANGTTVYRFVTSWATQAAEIAALEQALNEMPKK